MSKTRIIMLGTSRNTMGGISSVVQVWDNAGLFSKNDVVYVATHCDGSAFVKTLIAFKAFVRFMGLTIFTKPRLAHVQLSSYASFWRKLPFMTIAYLGGVPFIVHLHGSEFQGFYSQPHSRLRQAAIRWVFHKAALVCVLSKSWGAWVQAVSPTAKVEVVYNAVSIPRGQAPSVGATGAILFLGRIGKRKGVFDLLPAFADVARDCAGARLRLGGDGEVAAAQAAATELGLNTQVHMLGWVTGVAKTDELARASVFVLPSYNEGLPMSLLEAMAAGLPVVTTPVGGIPDAVTDGVEGFLVQPGDVATLASRLAQLLGDPALRRRMGEAGAKRVREQFSAEVAVERLSAIYERVAPRAGRP